MTDRPIKAGDIVRIKRERGYQKYLNGYFRITLACYKENPYGKNGKGEYLSHVHVRNVHTGGHREYIQPQRVEKLNAAQFMKLKKEGLI